MRELAAHPFHPRNPILPGNSPHVFFSPYSWLLGLLARSTGLPPVATLSLAGIVNLIFFLVFLRLFTRAVSAATHISFYTLVFTLVLWGVSPWNYSGFFHLNVLFQVLPYPSTFAAALTLMAFVMQIRYLRQGGVGWVLAVTALTAIVLLTHPITAISLVGGLTALAVAQSGLRSWRPWLEVAGICASAVLIATRWPLYSFLPFITSESHVFHESNAAIYQGFFTATFAALLVGLPPLVARARRNLLDPIVLLFSGLLLIYLYGGISGHSSYGRVIPYWILCLHIAAAEWASNVEMAYLARRELSRRALAAIAVAAVATLCVSPGLLTGLPIFQNSYGEYTFLTRATARYDVILSDLYTSLKVPVFGGKVVASPRPLAFVPDHEDRREAVRRFFEGGTPAAERFGILQRYGVDFVVLNRREIPDWPVVLVDVTKVGTITYSDTDLLLIRIRRDILARSRSGEERLRVVPLTYK